MTEKAIIDRSFFSTASMQPLRWHLHPELVVLETAGDGSCALHAVVQAFHPGYQSGRNPDGTPVNRSAFVREFRNDLAEMLNKPSEGEGSPTWYDRLSRGQLEEFAKATHGLDDDTPDLTREGFARHLRSAAWLGQEIVEYMGSMIGVGIFVLHEDVGGITRGVYALGKEEGDIYFKGRAKAVIIVTHANKHFSTVGRRESDGAIRTVFDMDDTLITEFLKEMS